jgi:hypothetical protein
MINKMLLAVQLVMCILLVICSGITLFNAIRWERPFPLILLFVVWLASSVYLTYNSYKELNINNHGHI